MSWLLKSLLAIKVFIQLYKRGRAEGKSRSHVFWQTYILSYLSIWIQLDIRSGTKVSF